MDDAPWPLPATWRWCRFDAIARVASNLVNPAKFPDWPHIAPNHIESETGKLLPYNTIAHDGVTSSKHRFSAGQVLYSKIRPYLAKVVVADFDGLCSADMYPIESELEARFLKWWMLSREFTRRAAGEQARTVLPKINVSALSGLPVPVPPVSEQRRIVEILEDHLSRLDAAATNLELARQRLRLLATSATEALRIEALETGGDACLGSLAITSGYGTSAKCVPDGPGPAVVRIPNLIGGTINLSDEKRIEEGSLDVSGLMLDPDDLLIVRTNGSRDLIGRTGVVQEGVQAAFASYLIRYKLDVGRVRPQWVHLMMQTPGSRRVLESMAASSAGQYNLSLSKLDRVVVPVPELDQQDRLLARWGSIEKSVGRIREELGGLEVRRKALHRSLLTAAFAGRLTGRTGDDEVVEELAGV